MNDILTSILSALHSFLTLPDNFIKREKGTFFFGFKRSHERREKLSFLQLEAMFSKAQNGTFFAVGIDFVKSAKKVPLKSLKI